MRFVVWRFSNRLVNLNNHIEIPLSINTSYVKQYDNIHNEPNILMAPICKSRPEADKHDEIMQPDAEMINFIGVRTSNNEPILFYKQTTHISS